MVNRQKMAGTLAGLLLLVAAGEAHGFSPRDIYKKAGPAVVLILGSDGGKAGAGGTGSVITPEGKVITNAHVVLNDAGKPYKKLYVFLKPPSLTGDNRKDLVNRYTAEVVDFSPAEELDLALLQIRDAPANLPTLSFANPDRVDIGERVVAIGHPEQGGLWTLTTGTISTVVANFRGVDGKHVFQTEASVNRGNSGGPLLNGQGNMVGINTMIARKGANGVTITDVNFSLKSSVAVKWLASRGMGLAYADPKKRGEKKEMVVALAPEKQGRKKDTEEAAEPSPKPSKPTQKDSTPRNKGDAEPVDESEPPESTVVVAEPPPSKSQAEKVRDDGKDLGKRKKKEKLVKGRPLDPKKAKPKYHTKRRPFDLDALRRKQIKELEDMMDEMRQSKPKGEGMGLW